MDVANMILLLCLCYSHAVQWGFNVQYARAVYAAFPMHVVLANSSAGTSMQRPEVALIDAWCQHNTCTHLLGSCSMLMASTSSAAGSAYGSHSRSTLLGVPVKLSVISCPVAAVIQKVLRAGSTQQREGSRDCHSTATGCLGY